MGMGMGSGKWEWEMGMGNGNGEVFDGETSNSVMLADNFTNVKMPSSQHCHLIDIFDAI
jgi:hypothetical protein